MINKWSPRKLFNCWIAFKHVRSNTQWEQGKLVYMRIFCDIDDLVISIVRLDVWARWHHMHVHTTLICGILVRCDVCALVNTRAAEMLGTVLQRCLKENSLLYSTVRNYNRLTSDVSILEDYIYIILIKTNILVFITNLLYYKSKVVTCNVLWYPETI